MILLKFINKNDSKYWNSCVRGQGNKVDTKCDMLSEADVKPPGKIDGFISNRGQTEKCGQFFQCGCSEWHPILMASFPFVKCQMCDYVGKVMFKTSAFLLINTTHFIISVAPITVMTSGFYEEGKKMS